MLQAAHPHDGPGIIALERELFQAADVFKPAQIGRILRSQTCRCLVVRDPDGTIQAEIVGLLRRFRGAPSGRIYKIALHRSLQGTGAAGLLLAAMEDIFRCEGMRSACAEARAGNAASIRFFEKHGYRLTKPLPRYYPDGEDGRKLWKSLDI